MKKQQVLFILLSVVQTATVLYAQNRQDDAYVRVLSGRTDKILAPLHLADSARYLQVKDLVVNQYRNVNQVHDEKKAQLEMLKTRPEADKAAAKERVEKAAAARLAVLHEAYIKALAEVLDTAQIEKIKDGMTFGVLPVTYRAYQDMIPSLRADEKTQILDWLTEARELAMDAGASEDKHRIFGKYKGRINNYLSARGYDLQKERKAWEERLAAGKK